MKKKIWESINTRKRVAHLAMSPKPRIKGSQSFAECLEAMKTNSVHCTRVNKCIVGLLIQALVKRGALL